MAAAKNLTPEQLRMASEQMRNMSPETLQQQAATYSSQLKGEQTYKVNGSQQLKTEGNALHAAGNYAAAMAKYQRALDNLQRMQFFRHIHQWPHTTPTHIHTQRAPADIDTPQANDLKRSCTLNLSSCTLHLGHYEECITHCNTILATDASNVKALYRRGQAFLHTQRYNAAVQDLQQAFDGSPADEQPVWGGCGVWEWGRGDCGVGEVVG